MMIIIGLISYNSVNILIIKYVTIMKVLEDGRLNHTLKYKHKNGSLSTITRRYCIEHMFDVDTEKVCRCRFGGGESTWEPFPSILGDWQTSAAMCGPRKKQEDKPGRDTGAT